MTGNAVSQLRDSMPIHIVHSRDKHGETCYFILRASVSQFNKLMAKRRKTHVNIAQYGDILASGYGTSPSAAVRAKILAEYGVNLPT